MNEEKITMTRQQSLLGETIQDVTLTAWPIVWADNKYDQDSRVVLEMLRDWAVEFENWWYGHDQEWRDKNSYYIEVNQFALRKSKVYVRQFNPVNVVPLIKRGVSLYDVICHWAEDRGCEEEFAIFDLENEEDFDLFYGNHSFKTIAMMRESRYWFDGLAYKETGPMKATMDDMAYVINDEVLGWIRESLEKGDDISHWDKVFYLDALRPFLQ